MRAWGYDADMLAAIFWAVLLLAGVIAGGMYLWEWAT